MISIDLISAAAEGAFALLDAAIDAGVAEVTTNPKPIDPKDLTERQFVIIGDVNSDNEGEETSQFERVMVQIVAIYRGRQRSKLHGLMHLVRVALEHNRPAIAGVSFGRVKWNGATSSPAGADGVTHVGVVEFEVLAQPN